MNKAAALFLSLAAAQPATANDFLPIFKEAFSLWVSNSARLDICNSTDETEGKVAEILDQAGNTFYPGWLEWSARSEFHKDMSFKASLAKTQGYTDWRNEGCFQIETLERVGRQTVDQVLEAVTLFPAD